MANLQNLPGCTAPYSQCSQQSCNNNGTLATECAEIRNLYGVISQKDSEINNLDQIRNNLINEGTTNNNNLPSIYLSINLSYNGIVSGFDGSVEYAGFPNIATSFKEILHFSSKFNLRVSPV